MPVKGVPRIATLLVLSTFLLARQETPVFRSSSRLVLLDIVATDTSGKPVLDLGKEDFAVSENKVPQQVLSFAGPKPEAALPAQAATVHNQGSRAAERQTEAERKSSPRTIILLDELNTQFKDLAYGRYSIAEFLKKGTLHEQPTALMIIGPQGLAMVQDFTIRTDLLLKGLSSIPPVLINPADGRIDRDLVIQHANEALACLEQIARAAVGYSSRLNVVWVTSGFKGLEPANPASSARSASDIGAYDYLAGLRSVANLLLQSRVSLYTIDPVGVIPEGIAIYFPNSGGQGNEERNTARMISAAASLQLRADIQLSHMTREMGGLSYYNRNDVSKVLNQAIEDGNSAYTLTYAPSHSDQDDSYRKIEVKVSRPGVSVRTRQGYYAEAQSAASLPSARETLLEAAVGSPLPYGGVRLTCVDENGSAAGQFKARILISPLGLTWTSQEMQQIVLVAAISSDHKLVGRWSWQIHWKHPRAAKLVAVPITEQLPQNTQKVRVVVSDLPAERIGTCDFDLRARSLLRD